MSANSDYLDRIIELEIALGKLIKQSQQTSESMGKSNPRRLFASDDFMMVWEESKDILESNRWSKD